LTLPDIGLELNRQAYERLRAEKRFEVIPGATHLFEEPGALEAVARLATAGFRHHLIELQQTASETSRGI
jgi:putative phosphoribosyl transferase